MNRQVADMEMVGIKCGNCGKDIYVYRESLREKMFCTLGCLDKSNTKNDHLQ